MRYVFLPFNFFFLRPCSTDLNIVCSPVAEAYSPRLETFSWVMLNGRSNDITRLGCCHTYDLRQDVSLLKKAQHIILFSGTLTHPPLWESLCSHPTLGQGTQPSTAPVVLLRGHDSLSIVPNVNVYNYMNGRRLWFVLKTNQENKMFKKVLLTLKCIPLIFSNLG